jgi:hypothetical protein
MDFTHNCIGPGFETSFAKCRQASLICFNQCKLCRIWNAGTHPYITLINANRCCAWDRDCSNDFVGLGVNACTASRSVSTIGAGKSTGCPNGVLYDSQSACADTKWNHSPHSCDDQSERHHPANQEAPKQHLPLRPQNQCSYRSSVRGCLLWGGHENRRGDCARRRINMNNVVGPVFHSPNSLRIDIWDDCNDLFGFCIQTNH